MTIVARADGAQQAYFSALSRAWSFYDSVVPVSLSNITMLMLLFVVLLAVQYLMSLRARSLEKSDVEAALEGENVPILPRPAPTCGSAFRAPVFLVVLSFVACALYILRMTSRAVAPSSVSGVVDHYEAHSMQCGTPDCVRDESVCGIGLSASEVMQLDVHGKAALDGTLCCRDLMLRMLIDVGAFLHSQNIEWYVTYGTLLGGVRDGSIIRWTDDVDIAIPSTEGMEALRRQRQLPYRFGHYGHTMMRGCANYAGVPTKLPHHPSGKDARMWIGNPPYMDLVSCEGAKCDDRVNPEGTSIPSKSWFTPSSWYVGPTAYYFMDVYSPADEKFLVDPACAAFAPNGTAYSPSKESVMIGGHSFPMHRNAKRCLESFYGKDFMTPTAEHVSDYAASS